MPSAVNVAKDLANYNNQLERSNVALQYNYNKALADQDRAWQERMSNSAHQREIKDLKAAGLNPVLSVTGGNGAAIGSGSSTQVSKPNVDMSLPGIVMDWATAQLNSATQLQRTAMETANAYGIAQLQADAAWQRHINPSGNSPLGQVRSVVNEFKSKLYNKLGLPYADRFADTGLPLQAFGSVMDTFLRNNSKSARVKRNIGSAVSYAKSHSLSSMFDPDRLLKGNDAYEINKALTSRDPDVRKMAWQELDRYRSSNRNSTRKYKNSVRSRLKNSRTRSSFRKKY